MSNNNQIAGITLQDALTPEDVPGADHKCTELGCTVYACPDLMTYKLNKDTNDNTKYEEVVHPQHYGGDEPYEVLKVLFAWGIGIEFCLGCAVKYIRRKDSKPGVDGYTDIEKASYYLKRAAEEMKRIYDAKTKESVR